MEDVIGTYGLVDAYNLEGDSPKIMKDYLGIDNRRLKAPKNFLQKF